MTQRDSKFLNGDSPSAPAPAPSKVVPVTTVAELEKLMAGAAGPVAVNFVADDCSYCEEAKPAVEKMAQGCAITVISVDVDKADSALLDRFGEKVDGTPTTLFSKTGAELLAGKTSEVDPEDKSFLKSLKCAMPVQEKKP